MALSEDQWKLLAQKEWGDTDDYVLTEWDQLWDRHEVMDEYDGTGELRYRAVVLDGFKLMLGPAQDEVNISEGGGQSIQAEARFQHLLQLHDKAQVTLDKLTKAMGSVGYEIAEILTRSLTPAYPGQYYAGHPGYHGDPRFTHTPT
jgi:hypothetical protein